MPIRRNAARCLTCGRTLESRHVHDFVACACPPETFIALDGGHEYLKVSHGPRARWTTNYVFDGVRSAAGPDAGAARTKERGL